MKKQPGEVAKHEEGRPCLFSYYEHQPTHVVNDVSVITPDGLEKLDVPRGITTFELEAARADTAEETERRAALIHERVEAIRARRERELVSQAVRELGLRA